MQKKGRAVGGKGREEERREKEKEGRERLGIGGVNTPLGCVSTLVIPKQ